MTAYEHVDRIQYACPYTNASISAAVDGWTWLGSNRMVINLAGGAVILIDDGQGIHRHRFEPPV